MLASPEGTFETDVVATTNSSGDATFDLYEEPWTISAPQQGADVNPSGTHLHFPHLATHEDCKRAAGHNRLSDGACVVDLTLGSGNGSQLSHPTVDVLALAAEIHVSLGSGLGLRTVVVQDNQTKVGVLEWSGAGRPRSQLTFLVPPPASSSGFSVAVPPAVAGAQPASVTACTPRLRHHPAHRMPAAARSDHSRRGDQRDKPAPGRSLQR